LSIHHIAEVGYEEDSFFQSEFNLFYIIAIKLCSFPCSVGYFGECLAGGVII
jgi:hypothetical protein